MITPSTAAACFLMSAFALGAAGGWALRLRLPVLPPGAPLLALPPGPRRRRSVQSTRRSLLLLSLSFALLFAVLGIVGSPGVLTDPSAPWFLLPAMLTGLLIMRFPLAAGLPLLLVLSLGILFLLVQAGPLSPRQDIPRQVTLLTLNISDDSLRIEIEHDRSEIHTLQGEAVRLIWQRYSLSPYLVLLRSTAVIPYELESGSLQGDDFVPAESIRLYSGTLPPDWLGAAVERFSNPPHFPHILQKSVLEFNQ